jgi:two-component system chemotaxis sensor kinase CheA
LRLRDQLLPLVTLGELLRLERTDTEPVSATVVVTAVGSGMLGIVVDDVYDTEEIVVKPVAPILRHVTMFSGNTILGDGSVIMILDPNGVARSAGVSASRNRRDQNERGVTATRSDDGTALLVFRAGGETAPRAVPLSLVARLEDIEHGKIERSGGGFVTQYRGKLMPLISMGDFTPSSDAADSTQPVLVFADGERIMGLMVDTIVDVVHDRLNIELGSSRDGILGTAVVAGQAAEVLDTSYWLTQAWRDWFGNAQSAQTRKKRLLIVEDSDFFRQLLVPALAAQGFEVTAAGSAAEALRLRDAGLELDAIISDIEMPDMNGIEFARCVREGGPWASLPMIALSGRASPADEARGREAGFTDYCHKFERETLMESLKQCLNEQVLM